jgi:hypothetical protein
VEYYCKNCFTYFHLRGALKQHRCQSLSSSRSSRTRIDNQRRFPPTKSFNENTQRASLAGSSSALSKESNKDMLSTQTDRWSTSNRLRQATSSKFNNASQQISEFFHLEMLVVDATRDHSLQSTFLQNIDLHSSPITFTDQKSRSSLSKRAQHDLTSTKTKRNDPVNLAVQIHIYHLNIQVRFLFHIDTIRSV